MSRAQRLSCPAFATLASQSRNKRMPMRPRSSMRRPFVAGMISAALILLIRQLGPWSTTSAIKSITTFTDQVEANSSGRSQTLRGNQLIEKSSYQDDDAPNAEGEAEVLTRDGLEQSLAEISPADSVAPRSTFSEKDVSAVTAAVNRYGAFARRTLTADSRNAQEGKRLQGRYLVLQPGNELVNRLRGVLSGYLLGMLTDRVFLADITYQKDGTTGLLNELFEQPGYEWDLTRLLPNLRNILQPGTMRLGDRKTLVFDMNEDHFHRWLCSNILGDGLTSAPVITLSTVVYPLPLIVRNPNFASHYLLAGRDTRSSHEDGWAGFAGGGQERMEALETLLTRSVLRPTEEMRHRARALASEVRTRAAAWSEMRGVDKPPRVAGIHLRTYYVDAVSDASLETNLEDFARCAFNGDGCEIDDHSPRPGERDSYASETEDEVFYFVATDESRTQSIAQEVWGDRCFFQEFTLPGNKLEGIKSALVDLLVMGSLDDFVITPHSSFSELGSSLSFSWLPEQDLALRRMPIKPAVPVFSQMNAFETRKILSLLDRRGAFVEGSNKRCVRLFTAGMSLAIARQKHLVSMFEAIGSSSCFKGRDDIANL